MNLLIFRHSVDIHSVHSRSEKHTKMQTFILNYVVFRTLQSTQEWLVAFLITVAFKKDWNRAITNHLETGQQHGIHYRKKKTLALRNVFLCLG